MKKLSEDAAKLLIERFAKKQNDAQSICPRCGLPYMESDMARNALSRRADIYVCAGCGMEEAVEDFGGKRLSLSDWRIATHPQMFGMLHSHAEHIRIAGHIGCWYVIDEGDFSLRANKNLVRHLFLLEHESYGDEAACLIVTDEGGIVLDDVWNGFDDLREAGWEDSQIE